MTKNPEFALLALPKSRIRAFALNPESARKVFGQTANPKTISETHARAEEFKANNLGESGPRLVKK